MITIFNGRKRTLGEGETKGIRIHRRKMLEALPDLKGGRLAVLLAYWLYRADEWYPTTIDLAECTGLAAGTVAKIYRQQVKSGLIPKPVCRQCGVAVLPEKLHRHHIIPDGQDYINICVACHNAAKPR